MYDQIWKISTIFFTTQILYTFPTSLNCIYNFVGCGCETQGTVGNTDTCDPNGQCTCKAHVEGDKCDECSAGYFSFPTCTGRLKHFNFAAQNSQHFFCLHS